MSMIEVKDMASLCGIFGNEVSYYLSKCGRNSCRDLLKMEHDTDACSMMLYVDGSDCVGVFVENSDREFGSQPTREGVLDENEELAMNEESNNEEIGGEIVTGVDDLELNKLFESLRDEKDKYIPDDDQSIGSDSVISERNHMVDSDCDVRNEDAEFYKNVQVDTNLGGLYTIASQPTPPIHIPTRVTRSNTRGRMYEGFRVFNPETDMDDPQFEHGMLFEGPKIFRDAVKRHSVKHGRQLKYGHNERTRIGLTCEADGCPWKIYAASYKNHGPHTLQVRHWNGEHRCTRINKIRAAGSNWMANSYGHLIQTIPKWNVKSMQSTALTQDKLKLSTFQLYRAKYKVEARVNGTVEEQYGLSCNYGGEIQRSDPTNTVKIKPLKRDDGKEVFKRMYICWGAMKRGFAEGLRKFICMDGCHLKTKNGGILLTAIGIDPNNSMYPIAYAIVEKENTDTWKWFLEYLQQDLDIPEGGNGWTFMSDKQKGLINAVEDLFEFAEHRFCVVHLYKNFKLSHSGLALQQLVWKAAKSTRPTDFQSTMTEVKEMDTKAAEWLAKRPATHWSRSCFRTDAKTDICVNNLSESLNGLIKESRSKPILEFLEDLRVLFMKKIWMNHQNMSKWWGNFCPNIAEKLEMQSFNSSNYQCLFNGEDEFEVEYLTGGKDSWVVNITNRTCSCRKWQLTGIPCSHAICCVKYLGRNEADYVDPCYTKERYMKVYSHCMHVLRGKSEWPESNKRLLPPIPEKMPGRPKKYHRKKTLQEIQDQKARMAIEKAEQTGWLGRGGMMMTCRYCNTPGHNKKGCLKRKADDAAKEADAAAGVKRSNNVVPNTETSIKEAATRLRKQKRKEKDVNNGAADGAESAEKLQNKNE